MLKRVLLGAWFVFVFALYFRLWRGLFERFLQYLYDPGLLLQYLSKFVS